MVGSKGKKQEQPADGQPTGGNPVGATAGGDGQPDGQQTAGETAVDTGVARLVPVPLGPTVDPFFKSVIFTFPEELLMKMRALALTHGLKGEAMVTRVRDFLRHKPKGWLAYKPGPRPANAKAEVTQDEKDYPLPHWRTFQSWIDWTIAETAKKQVTLSKITEDVERQISDLRRMQDQMKVGVIDRNSLEDYIFRATQWMAHRMEIVSKAQDEMWDPRFEAEITKQMKQVMDTAKWLHKITEKVDDHVMEAKYIIESYWENFMVAASAAADAVYGGDKHTEFLERFEKELLVNNRLDMADASAAAKERIKKEKGKGIVIDAPAELVTPASSPKEGT